MIFIIILYDEYADFLNVFFMHFICILREFSCSEQI